MAKLIRQRDNLIVEGVIDYLEFDENNQGSNLVNKPCVGCSCIVDIGSYGTYKWMTSEIIEVISDTEFKTKNSHYKIK